MNTYRHQFIARCPKNGKQIVYNWEIHAMRTIHVEHIVMAVEQWIGPNGDFHEVIADRFAGQFPNTRQTLKAHHHGVDIETVRGEL
jgi:hypothetical protein